MNTKSAQTDNTYHFVGLWISPRRKMPSEEEDSRSLRSPFMAASRDFGTSP